MSQDKRHSRPSNVRVIAIVTADTPFGKQLAQEILHASRNKIYTLGGGLRVY